MLRSLMLSRPMRLLLGLILLLAVGCNNGSSSVDAQQGNSTMLESSRLKKYDNISALTADSQAVVVITATSNRSVEKIGQIPFTITQVNVRQTLHGTMGERIIELRQAGDQTGSLRGAVPLVTPGATYVAFVKRFTYGPGRDTDQYVVVGGGAGLFLDQGGVLHRLDNEATSLPATQSLSELEARVSSG